MATFSNTCLKKSNGERSLACYNLKGVQARAPFRTKAKLLTVMSETPGSKITSLWLFLPHTLIFRLHSPCLEPLWNPTLTPSA